MKLLALDSSGLVASVAILDGETLVAEYTLNYKKTHSQTLLPMLDEIVKMTQTELSEVDAIAVAAGPGSFTGLRIGSATAKGLGLALNKPIISVPTLEGIACNFYGTDALICPMMDARRKQVYTGLYSFSHEVKDGTHLTEAAFHVEEQQMAIAVEELIGKLNAYKRPVVFLGDGVPVYRQMIEEGLEVPYSFAPSYMNRQRAAVVGALGIAYYYAGKYETAEAHKPDYLRVSQAERERAQREKEAKTEVREMTIEDGAVVAEIEHQSFSDAWSEKAILETLEQNNSVCFVAEKAGKRVGYLLGYTAVDEVEIARIAVIDEMKRQGVGHALMLALKAWSKEHQIAKVLLDVRESNQAAGVFYAREGFVNDGVRKAFYQDPKEDAVLMSLEIDK